jgi:DNA invertase Pin-like site-specific DNA recombinase
LWAYLYYKTGLKRYADSVDPIANEQSLAVYARYSSDRQSPASLQDQLRVCREYAEQQGWHLLEAHVYADEAFSAVGADRPEFVRMLEES